MGLKIATEIETDKGVTSEAYVRICGYIVSKYSNVVLMLEVFNAQSDLEDKTTATEISEVIAKCEAIGQTIYIPSIDIATLENVSIFAYGYEKLKDKLIGLYGAENIVDC
jgi:hypothetical protein